METSYIIAYMSRLDIRDNSEDTAGGTEAELVMTAICSTGNAGEEPRTQVIQHPSFHWYGAKDDERVFAWPNPQIGPVLSNGTPWALPIFSMPEDEMGDEFMMTVRFLEDDFSNHQSFIDILAASTDDAVAAIATAYTNADVGSAIGSGVADALAVVTASFAPDKYGVFEAPASRAEDWGVGRGPISQPISEPGEGSARVEITVERVVVNVELPVRVTLNNIRVPVDLDDDTWPFANASDLFVQSRVWAGKGVGSTPSVDAKRTPASGYRSMNSGSSWNVNNVLYEGPIGPFLNLELGVWDDDSRFPSSDDDIHGFVFAMWKAPELFQAFQANNWQPLVFNDIRRGNHLHLDFTIELTQTPRIPLMEWRSQGNTDYFTTSQEGWRSGTRRSPDYEIRDKRAAIFNPIYPKPDGTVPIHSLWNRQRKDNFLTSDPAYDPSSGARTDGYVNYRLDGYVFDPDLSQPRGTEPLSSWWNSEKQDNLTSSHPNWQGEIGDEKEGYTLYRKEGYVFRTNQVII